jgi:hypothetical protein
MLPEMWPEWWQWELDMTPHLLKRMVDRNFNEVDLREMLDGAQSFRGSTTEGRYVVSCRLHGQTWDVVVEPDEATQSLMIVTAYTRGSQ